MRENIIQSRQNPLVKHVVKLWEARSRKKHGQFLLEGCRELQCAINNAIAIEQLLYCPDLFSSEACPLLVEKAKNSNKITATEVTKDVFEKMSYREGPDGLLAIAKQEYKGLDAIKLSEKPLLLVAEGIEKPGNLGALIRTAEAVGCDALILTNSAIDLYNPNVIRSSQGLVFSLPVITTENESANRFLTEHGIQALATTPHCDTPYWEKDYNKASAIMIGSEKDGLSDFWLKSEHAEPITIPHSGQADSLNAGIAAAVVLFEVQRQRNLRAH
ncbi:MAG: RNA methyltransferase [Verrucomicrobia bacterium CG_4_10_14_3_um_filter_43_23]|nr:MAG: hypothetical protein AUJ82_04225 [Verrucomicrobia bacterium CG1_02_43_26]PIP59094.1 MAG: rRNA methyltransferase [Verrucomicrobia bacterium CG22_combo_CG10-13_8_21_14_all_43_17]PIX58231.1 MAG: RNA methyltransferase [Verrucomicrobia bacterium CG_4_10_14_3_um_filter_43_23]PIY62351.1 MAG: RNA methyltransferase [Verrucomicrobia bacterium CG_4_10_14_0_8_um_filter_43_34]PJA44069.1 MAG: RNA methyltransferase [Verrucomicrobia bacterium CG_4_9_14_3_um_filter_43_20]